MTIPLSIINDNVNIDTNSRSMFEIYLYSILQPQNSTQRIGHNPDVPTITVVQNKRKIASIEIKEKQFKCRSRDYITLYTTYLKMHMFNHSEKPFLCNRCPIRFIQKLYFLSHMRTHVDSAVQIVSKFF